MRSNKREEKKIIILQRSPRAVHRSLVSRSDGDCQLLRRDCLDTLALPAERTRERGKKNNEKKKRRKVGNVTHRADRRCLSVNLARVDRRFVASFRQLASPRLRRRQSARYHTRTSHVIRQRRAQRDFRTHEPRRQLEQAKTARKSM